MIKSSLDEAMLSNSYLIIRSLIRSFEFEVFYCESLVFIVDNFDSIFLLESKNRYKNILIMILFNKFK